jgi:hypothetical protein
MNYPLYPGRSFTYCNVQFRADEVQRVSGIPRNFFRGESATSVEDRGQIERESGGGSPLVKGSTQFANE